MIIRLIVCFITIIVFLRNIFIDIEFPVYLYYLCFLSVFIISILKGGIKIDRTMLYFIFWAIVSLVLNNVSPMFKAEERLLSFVIVVSSISPFLNSSFLYSYKFRLINLMNLVIVYVVVISFIGYLLSISSFTGRSGFNGLVNHSLLLGYMSGVSTIICFVNYLFSKQKIDKIKYLFLILISLLVCLISASRTAFVSIIISLFLMIYVHYKNRVMSIFKELYVFVIIIFISTPLWIKFSQNILEKHIARSEGGSALSGRDIMWLDRFADFQESPFYGVGFASMRNMFYSRFSDDGVVEPGSSWFFVLSTMGIVGLVLFSIMIFKPIWYVLHTSSNGALNLFVLGILSYCALHMGTEGYVLSSGAFCFVYLWLCIGISKYVK